MGGGISIDKQCLPVGPYFNINANGNCSPISYFKAYKYKLQEKGLQPEKLHHFSICQPGSSSLSSTQAFCIFN
ncbi:auxin-responsive protein SAUR23-like [Gossypium australe]|uniref:Auxin-responsive protein SAUR23-like n=1 Tax=Gossypium australe TaxID=47621 RepID=A0A5B6X4D6_9ROSI|nr:auxin-responsive protein SAUR23-like [Gossypium australe]